MTSQRPLPAWIAVPLEGFQRAPVWLSLGVAMAAFALPAVAFELWFPSAACSAISAATHHWVNATIQFQVVTWAAFLMALRAGGLHARHAGFLWSQAPAALATTVLLWMAVQLTAVAGQALAGPPVAGNPGLWDHLPSLATQLLGVGPCEETIFRGFLVPQCYLWLRRRQPWSATTTLIVSLLVTQVFFATIHIWVDVEGGAEGPEMFSLLARRFLYGLFAAVVWLRTGNLLIGAGFHGLSNEIMPLFMASDMLLQTSLVVWTGILALVWKWPQRDRWPTAVQAL